MKQEEREVTELEVALHRARALLGEKEIRLRHIERALRRLADTHPPLIQVHDSKDLIVYRITLISVQPRCFINQHCLLP